VAEKGTFSSPHNSPSGVEWLFKVVQDGPHSRLGVYREKVTTAAGYV
jgi:hypothetical protein